jgi:ribulose-phosphate 3-epimerase
MHLVAPSLLSADFGNLQRDIEIVNNSDADWFHVDIMDGLFVPNISFGFPVLKYIKELAKKPLDVHLMIVDPDRYLERFRNAGAEIISIHIEGCNHLHRSIHAIKESGAKAGVVLNPHTAVSSLNEIIQDIDLVMIMSVNPGYGGQSFIKSTFEKVKKVKEMILKKDLDTLIEIDGGVNLENAGKLVEYGADVLVAGNTVFGSDDPAETISLLKRVG